MPTLQESLDALDRMIDGHATKPELRNQIAFIGREVIALEADYAQLAQNHAALNEAHAKLQRAQFARNQEVASENRHKVGVTFKNGKTVYYNANGYALLPNKNSPVTIEFRMLDKETNTYQEAGHAKWEDVSEVHEPTV